jgi:hypothetical protein
MNKHLKSDFLTHCVFKIAERVDHDFEHLPIISPELSDKLHLLHKTDKNRFYKEPNRDYYLSINKKNNELLTDTLKVLKQLRKERLSISEENIKSLLNDKINGTSKHHFWLVLRIAIYELGYMKD